MVETCRAFGLVADYGNGLVLSYALRDADAARIDVLETDGRKVAHFDARASARNLSLPLSLSRGRYLVMVEGGASRFVAPLAVAA